MQLVPFRLEQVSEPLPTISRLERDLQLTAQFGQDRLERFRVVRHSAREQLRPCLVEGGDLGALAVEIDADVDHCLGLLPVPTSLVSSGIAPEEDGAQEARFFMASSCWTGVSFARVLLGAGDRELKRRRWGCLLPRCLAA
jgi:hypothetical protein